MDKLNQRIKYIIKSILLMEISLCFNLISGIRLKVIIPLNFIINKM